MVAICPQIIKYLDFSDTLLLAIVDPESPKLPLDIKENWRSIPEAYCVGRNFVYAMYRKRKRLLEILEEKKAIEFNQ